MSLVGPKQTNNFLRTVGEKLDVSNEIVEEFVENEERKTYRFFEYAGDAIILVRPHSYFAVVADTNAVINITQFLANEFGYLPDIIQITDNPPEEYRDAIIEEITEKLETPVKPEIFFENDSHLAREKLRNRPFQFLFSSSLEAPTAMSELDACHVTVGFPSYNRLVLGNSYTGYDGGLKLMEDFISTFAGPL